MRSPSGPAATRTWPNAASRPPDQAELCDAASATALAEPIFGAAGVEPWENGFKAPGWLAHTFGRIIDAALPSRCHPEALNMRKPLRESLLARFWVLVPDSGLRQKARP